MARGLQAAPYVVVANTLQLRAFRHRLAWAGGSIGVRVLTFEGLYRLILSASGTICSEVSEAVQHRVLRAVVRGLPLVHYAPLTDRPGFVEVLRGVIDELKAARVTPEVLRTNVDGHGSTVRLRELADIYAAYEARLRAEAWADPAGLGCLAVEALEGADSLLGREWPLLLVDGFDDFTAVQLALLRSLAGRVDRIVITLTGSLEHGARALVHRRFERTRRELEEILGVEAEPLPGGAPVRGSVLRHLEGGLFRSGASQLSGEGRVELIEATDRAGEVRAALRWLKKEIVEGDVRPGDLALLARDVTPYRPYIRDIAAEFGVPIHFHGGEPLAKNPAVSALMDLLRLMLPVEKGRARGGSAADSGPEMRDWEPALPPRLVIEAWRSPYFDWSAQVEGSELGPDGTGGPIGIGPGDADTLGMIVRRGRVIAGLEQWESAFEVLERTAEAEPPGELEEPEEPGRTPRALSGRRAEDLHGKFRRFVRRLQPPGGRHGASDFVRWFEMLIGDDPEGPSGRFQRPDTPTSLNIVARARGADDLGKALPGVAERPLDGVARRWGAGSDRLSRVVERDVAALGSLKKALRGLIWAEEAVDGPPISFPRFFEELSGAVEAAFYRLPRRADGGDILVSDVVDARGVAFRAVALVGMAEGVFPEGQSEDPLLHDGDREALDLPLQPATESAEAEYFYETIAAPAEKLLLTRPRLADDGAPWEASPFWEEIRRLVDVTPDALPGTSPPPLHQVASWPELLQGAVAAPEAEDVWRWLRKHARKPVPALEAASRVMGWRYRRADSPFDGGLERLRDHFAERFYSGHTWSASRLEAYRTCPFLFFVSKVLRLEPRERPSEGIDWLQRGILYHEMLERVYRAVDDPTDLEQLLMALRPVADAVLDGAPERQGFRETAWWAQTRREMVEHVEGSLRALHEDEQRGDFVPVRHEAAFGLGMEPALIVPDVGGEDAFALRGVIDRVDRDPEGRVRIIDYKTAGPSRYGNTALRRGEKIQLPLYALAARDALGLGQPASGFYWHVRHAKPSGLKLEDFGPDEAIRTAVAHAWEAIHSAREGRFAPRPPKAGCPPYCPAVGFCWQFDRGYRG